MSAPEKKASRERPVIDSSWTVLAPLLAEQCPVGWMAKRLPADVTSVVDRLPPLREHVVGWLSAPNVCIWFVEAIVWRSPGWSGVAGVADEWWSGLPGAYIDLHLHRWHLSHWRLIERQAARASLQQSEAVS